MLVISSGSQISQVVAWGEMGSLNKVVFFFFFGCPRVSCGTLIPLLGIKPIPTAVEAWRLNHWTSG